METTSKPKVTIPLVAAIPIPYTTIPINLFHGKVDCSAKSNGGRSNRTQPYTVIDSRRSEKACSTCNNQAHNQSTSGEQIKVSSMYNGSPMLILPFVSAKPSQIQQKALPNIYNQHPLSVYHAKKSEDLSGRVIWEFHNFYSAFYFILFCAHPRQPFFSSCLNIFLILMNFFSSFCCTRQSKSLG